MKEEMNLPENAFRELKDGEEYKPLMSPDKIYRDGNHLLCSRSLSGSEGWSGF